MCERSTKYYFLLLFLIRTRLTVAMIVFVICMYIESYMHFSITFIPPLRNSPNLPNVGDTATPNWLRIYLTADVWPITRHPSHGRGRGTAPAAPTDPTLTPSSAVPACYMIYINFSVSLAMHSPKRRNGIGHMRLLPWDGKFSCSLTAFSKLIYRILTSRTRDYLGCDHQQTPISPSPCAAVSKNKQDTAWENTRQQLNMEKIPSTKEVVTRCESLWRSGEQCRHV